jgi:Ser/Thr protein kinase RdoA (MazF antagonist)
VEHRLRVLTWIDGTVLAECTPRGGALLESIGASMARVDLALSELAHPAMHRVLQWDLRHAGIARAHAALLPEPVARARGDGVRALGDARLDEPASRRHSR